MKICAVVVTYYPNISELFTNISQYIDSVDHLIVWENTPQQKRGDYKINLPEYSYKITYMSREDNVGIAFPLNRAVEFCLINGYSHLLTMDQDSRWADFELFKAAVKRIAICNIAAYVPIIPEIYDWNVVIDKYREVEEYITSGTIYNIQAIKDIGLFREDYFIDAVDIEFCYRSQNCGYKAIQMSDGKLYHRLGYSKRFCKFITTPNYSAVRTYFIIRNHIWLWREYPKFFKKKYFILRHTIFRLFLIILVENNKLEKIKSIFKGVFHGISRQYCSNPSRYI